MLWHLSLHYVKLFCFCFFVLSSFDVPQAFKVVWIHCGRKWQLWHSITAQNHCPNSQRPLRREQQFTDEKALQEVQTSNSEGHGSLCEVGSNTWLKSGVMLVTTFEWIGIWYVLSLLLCSVKLLRMRWKLPFDLMKRNTRRSAWFKVGTQ